MTKEVDSKLVERMANAIRRHVGGMQHIVHGRSVEAEFRAIADLLPPPVDPDLEMAREVIADAVAYGMGISSDPDRPKPNDFRVGNCDAGSFIETIVIAVREARFAAQQVSA